MAGPEGNNNNPNGNLATLKPGEAGKDTRFGTPRGASNRQSGGSIRAMIRRIAHMHPDDVKDMLKKGDITMAMVIAAKKMQLAAQGNVKAMQQLEDSIDGKLVEKVVNAETTLEDLVNGSFEHEQQQDASEAEGEP